MGGATRFMTLLTAPFPPLRPSIIRLHHRVSSLAATPRRLFTRSSPSKTKIRAPQLVNCFHSQSSNNTYALHSAAAQQHQQLHPWPEWNCFLDILSNGKGFYAGEDCGIPPEDAFVVYEKLPDDFVRAAAACIAFARARPDLLELLSRRDIEAVVSNGTPFLFKSVLNTARRMRAFLAADGSNVSDIDKANTVDLMKYIISYASNPATVSSERNGLYSRELVDSSVRNLLHQLATICGGVSTGYMPASGPQFLGRDVQTPRPFGQNIEMKRGDWICPKCNFMNFARNMKCLECEEQRPKKQLTGGEWECPQCNFFNYGRNTVCLRCDCRQPGAPLFNNSNSQSGNGYNGDYSYKTNVDNRLVTNEEKAQQWFSKISQMNHGSDINKAASYEDFPENMPLRQGESGFVSTRKTPLEGKLANSQHQNNLSDNGNTAGSTLNTSTNCSLDLGGFSSVSGRADFGITPQHDVGTDFSHPAHTFSRRDQTSEIDDGIKVSMEAHESRNLDEKEQDEKSERWFKRLAELHDVKDLPSAVSDEDFPEIMPMRKGENRFVVSKKKDRSLTSPKYKRQVAMDQANNTNFVPFVPFPPGYFARKDTEQPSGQDSPVNAVSETSFGKNTEPKKSDDSKNEMPGRNDIPRTHNQPMSSAVQSSPAGSTVQSSTTPRTINGKTSTDGYSGTRPVSGGASPQRPEDESVRSGWTGKSLEGSAVKEPDPLDMSEEAKAERWFKRVAQIKDISELSQIPDEDFPSIMPMRKGVNRFVVSKRKTPLERRLTSQQYRRNLPIVSNDSVKKDSDNS